ncbi:MAG: polysaccharide biosynthesis tyrosine autokinase [Elusimicrobia bacterium]|nr:polysaccharide biosynthesis tyrosine autokinase [Elusimicrobiota bacterium]
MPTITEPQAGEPLDLTYYLDVVLRRRWIVAAAMALVAGVTAVATFTTKPVYQASALLVIEKERGGLVQNGSMVENSNEDYYQTQYKLLQSVSLLRKVYAELALEKAPDFSGPQGFERFQKAVAISPVLRSRLVYVRADSHDAKLAADIANRLSQDFVDQNLSNQLFISKEVLQALQMKDGQASYDSLPAVVNNSLIQTLKGEYAKLRSQYADMSQRYTDKYPAMSQLKSNMAALEGQIRTETERVVASLKTELSGQLKGNNVRIIDPADVPARPYKPRKRFNLTLGLLGGLLAGVGLAFLIETLDQSIRTQEDVEEKVGKPFLGVIPQAVLKKHRIYEAMLAEELSLTSEAFRNLRTMIDFAGVGGKAKSLLVTSTVQGEGKTYAAANLAVAMAQLGESVILIDGDLRRPNVHRGFAVSSERGLSDFLVAGRHADDAARLVQKTDVPGLEVLPCGQRPPNPSELLNTPRLGALVAWARERYDRVIVDCTPMFPINDTLLWGRHIPSGVFVVRYGVTRTPLIRTACQKLETGGIKLLGVAVNAARQGGLAYSSYGYYYQQYYHSYQQPQAAPTGGEAS